MKLQISKEEIEKLIKTHYRISVSARPLSGYDELNFLLTDRQDKKYILKISPGDRDVHFQDAQVKILKYLATTSIAKYFQKHLPNIRGEEVTQIILDGKKHFLRILTFLEGTFWADSKKKSAGLYKDLGKFMGTMDKTLAGFSHPALHRHYPWDISTAADANTNLKYITDHERRRMAGYFLLQFETEVMPVLSSLRHAYVHNDANDYNILVHNNKITGLIDFGDMVYTALVNNLAVTCTYAMLNTGDPLHAATLVVKGYHAKYPLKKEELDLLYYLIAARLCISVTQSAYQASKESGNRHHFVTETPAWDLLYKLIRVNPVKAQNTFRKVCGFEGVIRKDDNSGLLGQRKKNIGLNLSISYRKPLKIVKGALQYLYDDQGRAFVDCVNNPSHVGHCHPVVVKRMQKQLATLNTNTRYLSELIVEYAKRLKETLPPSLNICYFVNSGSEANDLAIRMSRHLTGQKDIIVLDHAYHGTTTLDMEMSPYKFDGAGGFGRRPWIHKAECPDLYRGRYRYGDARAGEKYAQDVQRIIDELKAAGKAPAAFISETLLGVGGQLPLPRGYLKQAYHYVRAAGGVCIADEVQVGFGRVGEKFWGFQLQEAIPDIVVMGKPIGNGHPLAAIVVTNEIAEAFDNGMEYFNTYGGNPVSMTAGLAVLDVIQNEEMQKHALETGNYLMAGLKKLMNKHPVIGDVRGHGLFIGVELVKDRKTLEPAVPEIDLIVEKMKDRGYLLSTDGPLHNVLKIKPPLPFNKQNAAELLQYLDETLEKLPGT